MMFMMPMPPTTSDTAAMLASSSVVVRVVSSATLANSERSRTVGSSGSPSFVRWRWRSSSCTARIAACVVPAAVARHEDARDGVGLRAARVEELPPHRRVRHEDDVVLVLAHLVLALDREHAQHLARQRPHAHELADGIVVAEELLGDGAAEHADLGRRLRCPAP